MYLSYKGWDYHENTRQIRLHETNFCLDYNGNVVHMRGCYENPPIDGNSCGQGACKMNQEWYNVESNKVGFPAKKYSAKYQRTAETSPFDVRVEHGLFLDDENIKGPLDKMCIDVDPNHKIRVGPATIHFKNYGMGRTCATIDDLEDGGLFQHSKSNS